MRPFILLFRVGGVLFQRASSHSGCGRVPGPPEFPKFAIVLGSSRPLCGRKNKMSSVKATQLRPGMVIRHEGQLYTIFSVDHRTPGNKRGSMQTRMRNLRTGAIIDYRFRAEE